MRQPFFQALLQRRIFKFCVVGASSTVIDKGIFGLLLVVAPGVPWFVSQSISFLFGVTNGYYWNRKWTFQSDEQVSIKSQYPKFIATNVVGLLLTELITKGFAIAFTGHAHHTAGADNLILFLSSFGPIPFVVVWNFTASRLWTFAPPKSPATPDAASMGSPQGATKSR